MPSNKKLDAEKLEQTLLDSQASIAQASLDEWLQTPGMTARELFEAFSRPSLAPLLDRLMINARSGGSSATTPELPKVTQVEGPKKRGRPPKKVEDGILDKNKATIKKGAKRSLTVYTAEQKSSQRELIYKTVADNQKKITTPQIIRAVMEEYPEINDSVVREMIKDMATAHHLKALQRSGGKTQAIHYATNKPL